MTGQAERLGGEPGGVESALGAPAYVVLDPAEAIAQLRRRPLEQITGVLILRSDTLRLEAGAVVPGPGSATVVLNLPRRWAPEAHERSLVIQLDGHAGRLECTIAERTSTSQVTVLVCRVVRALGESASFVQPSNRRSFDLADDAYVRAREMVLVRLYPADSTLDPDELSFDLSADPSAVVFALTRLELDGLVRRDPDRGYVVVPFDVRSSDETFDARCAIEVGVLETALTGVDNSRITDLRLSFEVMSGQLVGSQFLDFERYLDANADFHQRIVMLSQNESLRAFYQRLGVKAVMARSFGSTRSTSQRFVDVQQSLLERIEARDVDGAKAAAIAYRDLAKARAHDILNQTGGWL